MLVDLKFITDLEPKLFFCRNYSGILSALNIGKIGIPQYIFLHNPLHFCL